jgi:CBS domain-containing protein
MAQKIGEVMTHDPRTVELSATLADAAREMRDADIGALVVVEDGGKVAGLVTDRDIVVRAIAEDRDPSLTQVADVATRSPGTLLADQAVDDAIRLMRDWDVRRVVVVSEDDGRAIGIVSIGDLAVDRDPDSLLADISAEAPNN